MEDDLRIVLTPAERHGTKSAALGLMGVVLEVLLNTGSGGPVGSSGSSGGAPVGSIKKYPEVAVINAVGHTHVLEVLDTDEEGEERAAEIEEDLLALSIPEWCKRYRVPLAFVEEHE
jgi:hypothetical protein